MVCASRVEFHAWKLVPEMRDMGQPADKVTYNSFLHTFCKNRQLDKAIALVKEIHYQ